MGNIVGKLFGVVASKNYTTALAESVKAGNEAKFYLVENQGRSFNEIANPTVDSRNTLIVNGNKIQGVSDTDLSKLNAISDVASIFKYKGTVDSFDLLPKKAEVGDVYNIQSDFTIDNIEYPAYTNVVCKSSEMVGSIPDTKWDSLGGTMQIGTGASKSKFNDRIIHWEGKNQIPISSFNLEVSTGLIVGDGGVLSINIGSGLKSIGEEISLQLSTESTETISPHVGAGVSGLNIDDQGGLHVALATSSDNGRRYLVHLSKGIALDYAQLVTSLKADTQLKTYINSLIDAKLKAQ